MKVAKGKAFFTNVALLMAIFPVYNIALGLFNGDGPFAGLIQISDLGASTGLVRTGVVISIIGAVVSIIVGIIGMKNASKPEKMNACIMWGILVLLIYSVAQVLDYVGGGVHDTLDYVGMFAGLGIPAFYIVGAVQTKAGE